MSYTKEYFNLCKDAIDPQDYDGEQNKKIIEELHNSRPIKDHESNIKEMFESWRDVFSPKQNNNGI